MRETARYKQAFSERKVERRDNFWISIDGPNNRANRENSHPLKPSNLKPPESRSRRTPLSPLIVNFPGRSFYLEQVSDTRVILRVARTAEIAPVFLEPDVPAAAGLPRSGQAADCGRNLALALQDLHR